MNKHKIFEKEIESIKDDDIRRFAILLLDNAPDYFYTVAASSSGRYHPEYSLGEGGLVRHTKSVIRLLNHFFNTEQYDNLFTDKQKDLMRVACLYHDGEKQGKGNTKNTVHEHPIYAANTIRSYKGKCLCDNDLEYIATIVESHMGIWSTSRKSKIELPKPQTDAQRMVHLADYLSSRKDIEIVFDDYIKPEPPKIEDYEMGFGKFKGVKIREAFAQEKSYFDWLMSQDKFPVREPLKGFVKQLMRGE